jgi:hypothetical protein
VGGDQAAPFHHRRGRSEVSVPTIEDFHPAPRQYATDHKGSLPPGSQTGIALFPCLVSARVALAALAWAEARQLVQFAVMARPVATAARGVVGAFKRTQFRGGLCAPHLRRKLTPYFDGALQALDGSGH